MELSQLFKKIKIVDYRGDLSVQVADVCIDSRQVKKGGLFIAVRGTQTDSHAFIPQAIGLGAAAIVCETYPEELDEKATYVRISNTSWNVGEIATQFYGNPSSKFKLVGVTGTNGKTTIATLLYKLFSKKGYKCGLCSTICNYIGEETYEATHTTPDPISLNRLMAKMAEEGCEYVFIECSSHSIHQNRIGGLTFAGAIFTNLTRDHLDYHKTIENYRDAKKMFFDGLNSDAFAIINLDDRNGLYMVQNCMAVIKTYSQQQLADFHAKIVEMELSGMELSVNGYDVFVSLVGKFNVSNLLAIFGAAVMLGVEPAEALEILSGLHSVSGRFETVQSPAGVTAVVDYAHTPDALANVLGAIKEVVQNRGNIITVCGAGGNRDKGKRPLMANEAAKVSDKVIITSDNPRFEEPQAIIEDMLAGITKDQKKRVISIVDRREAIHTACMIAQKGDVILIAGKGHENYQDVKGVKHHFDDKETICEFFNV